MAWKDVPARVMDGVMDGFGYQECRWFGAWLLLSALMVAFVIDKLPMVVPSVAERSVGPGEWFRFEFEDSGLAYSHTVLAVHVASVFIWTVCGTCQFIPMIRKQYPCYHRLRGRIYFIASVHAVATSLMLESTSFGGDFSARSASWTIGGLYIAYGALGFLRAVQRRIQEHKRWMLRMYAVGISVVFSRVVIPVAGLNIIPAMDLWGTMPCGQIRYELRDAVAELQQHFPTCFEEGTSDDLVIALRAGTETDVHTILACRMAFSVGLWLGLLANMIAVELYIHHEVPDVAPAPTRNHKRVGVEQTCEDLVGSTATGS